MAIEPNDTVDDVMRRWPGTVTVFLRNRMRCIGCPVGRIHTVAEACGEHRLDPAAVLDDLRRAADAPPPERGDEDPSSDAAESVGALRSGPVGDQP